ncbi:MAG: LPP20 family lipoprotein [Bdellovibrionales bacterium]|nr:LPP20 family lipoprotein [Bdellovibrionales bacterium]
MKTTNTPVLVLSLSLAFTSLGLGACSSAPTRSDDSSQRVSPNIPASAPAWVKNPYGAYPDNRYLVAIGSGRDRNAAIDDAKKQMAESFVVKVKTQTTIKTKSRLNEETSGAVVGKTENESDRDLSLTTETFLRGAEVKETSDEGDETYALVAVDKLKARSGLLLEANKSQAKLNSLMDSLESKYTQEKYAQTKAELAALEQLFGEASALGMSALIDIAPMEARMDKVENAIRARNEKWIFAVRMEKGSDFFAHDLEGCINDRGGTIYVNEQAPKNSNKVEITLVERKQHQQIEGWEKIRFDVTAAIVQNDGRKYRITASQTETGRSRDAILESVSDKLGQDLCDRLFARMSEVGNTSVKQ